MATETAESAPAKSAESHEHTGEVKPENAQPRVSSSTVAGEPLSRVGRAEAIIQRNVLWSLGTGLLPLPLLDMALTMGVQVKMLKELSDLYEADFSEAAVKKVLVSLVSSVGGVGIGSMVGASLTKLLPGIGTTLGVVSAPAIVGAFTYATGRVFLMHFESGGTVLTFDPHAMRAHFRREYERAKEAVARIQREERAKHSPKVP